MPAPSTRLPALSPFASALVAVAMFSTLGEC